MKVFGVPCPTPTKKNQVYSFLCYAFPEISRLNLKSFLVMKVMEILAGILMFELLVKKMFILWYMTFLEN